MARPAILFGQLTDETMNSGESYRVKFSYGVFSIAAKVTQSGTYYSACKRHRGRLFKVYVAKAGKVTKERLHQATMTLSAIMRNETGDLYPRDNRARNTSRERE